MSLELKELTKRFGTVTAVDKFSVLVEEGEFFTLLGPSGCGKSTALKLIAGFYTPDEGEIYIDDHLVNDMPPFERNVGIVFQNYALFPHMTVFDNIAYGLGVRKLPKEEIKRRVKESLELIGLEGLGDRRPDQLSGGQQQRVAVARALITNPKILLLDEPLSNLDAKLRLRMRTELRKLHKDLGLTAIYVTHDQDEARSMSDRITIMRAGRLEQLDNAEDIFRNPKTRYVADFVGFLNLFETRIHDVKKNEVTIEVFGQSLTVPTEKSFQRGETVTLALRPELITILNGEKEGTSASFVGKIESKVYIGSIIRYTVDVEGGILAVDILETEEETFQLGEKITIGFRADSIRLFKK